MKPVHFLILIVFASLMGCTEEGSKETTEVIRTEEDIAPLKAEEAPEVPENDLNLKQSLINQGLVNIQEVDSELRVDLKYSTTDNFFGQDVYGSLTEAFAPKDIAEKLKAANSILQEVNSDYRLIVFDAVRPLSVQQILWDALDSIPVARRSAYVADPRKGSLHNYGCAIDLSIIDISKNSLLDMGTKYDYFGYLAYPRKEKEMLNGGQLTEQQVFNREILREVMTSSGFSTITSEWWHFNSTSLAKAKLNYRLIK